MGAIDVRGGLAHLDGAGRDDPEKLCDPCSRRRLRGGEDAQREGEGCERVVGQAHGQDRRS